VGQCVYELIARDMATLKRERADKARNRARILSAASEVFEVLGLDAQMDAIAARAGVGVGTLYGHFATKDALMQALIERKFEMLLDIARRGLARDDADAFGVLADVLRHSAAITAADAGTRAAVMDAEQTVLDVLARVVNELREATQLLIDRARATQAVRDDITADDISLMMHGLASTMGHPGRDWNRLLELMLDGMRGTSALNSSDR
jgi:AcrR family transcriptional regulator